MNFDSYYDPPEQDETCQICHYQPDDCTCPECEVCSVQGDPDCINKHMDWTKFPHFSFALSESQRKAEKAREEELYKIEKEMFEDRP